MIARYATTLALVCGLAWPAFADSPLTSTETNSKTAARIGPSPYAGNIVSPDQARKTVTKGLQVIKQTQASWKSSVQNCLYLWAKIKWRPQRESNPCTQIENLVS